MRTSKKTCTMPGCTKPYEARGYCPMHYKRWQAHGDPMGGRWHGDPKARFRNSIQEIESGCWIWQLAADRAGYGVFTIGYDKWFAHRWSYEQYVGPIPDGLVVDHLCRTPMCVNPSHLEAVTQAENLLRGEGVYAKNKRKSHCLRGHEFDAANTYMTHEGYRQCRKCNSIRQQASVARKRRMTKQ